MLFYACLAAVLFSGTVDAQDNRVRFEVSVEAVTLDVVVVDKRGRCGRGLSAEDGVSVEKACRLASSKTTNERTTTSSAWQYESTPLTDRVHYGVPGFC